MPLKPSKHWKQLFLAVLAAFLLSGLPARAAITDTPVPQTNSDGSIKAGYDDHHERCVQWNLSGHPRVVFYGDSLSSGWTTSGKGLAVWRTFYAPRQAVNLAFTGNKTQNVLWEIQNGHAGTFAPQVAVLLIGTNNLGNSTADIVLGINAIVDELRARMPGTKVLLLCPFPRGLPGSTYWNKLWDVGTACLARDNGDTIRALRIWSEFLLPDGSQNPSLFPDGVHPSPAGYQVWATAMDPLLSAMLGE